MIPQLRLPHGGQSPHREHKRDWTYSTAGDAYIAREDSRALIVTSGSPQVSPRADNRGSVSPRTKRTTVLHYDVLQPADETHGSVTHRASGKNSRFFHTHFGMKPTYEKPLFGIIKTTIWYGKTHFIPKNLLSYPKLIFSYFLNLFHTFLTPFSYHDHFFIPE